MYRKKMSLLSETELIRSNKIILYEGKMMEIINKSCIVSLNGHEENFSVVKIHLLEIFSSEKFPVGQSLELNKNKLKKLFKNNTTNNQVFDTFLDNVGIILVFLGEDHEGRFIKYIWDGINDIPWEIGKPIITKKMMIEKEESKDSIENLFNTIKYTSPELDSFLKFS